MQHRLGIHSLMSQARSLLIKQWADGTGTVRSMQKRRTFLSETFD